MKLVLARCLQDPHRLWEELQTHWSHGALVALAPEEEHSDLLAAVLGGDATGRAAEAAAAGCGRRADDHASPKAASQLSRMEVAAPRPTSAAPPCRVDPATDPWEQARNPSCGGIAPVQGWIADAAATTASVAMKTVAMEHLAMAAAPIGTIRMQMGIDAVAMKTVAM